jgi:starch synthase (maltosyl-transferring)
MEQLAKLGFSQSYTYFTWRNSKYELEQYMRELTAGPASEYFRPNFWPNTPDILHESLQTGGRPAFIQRLVLAATLSASFGIYGPAYELCVNAPRDPGTEEYLDSEKYEVKHWDTDAAWSLKEFITRINRARRDNAALHRNDTLRLLDVNNDQMMAYIKTDQDSQNVVVVVVNLDVNNTQSGTVQFPWWELGMDKEESYQLYDVIDGALYTWRGEWNYVSLNPHVLPAHVFQLRRFRPELPELRAK